MIIIPHCVLSTPCYMVGSPLVPFVLSSNLLTCLIAPFNPVSALET